VELVDYSGWTPEELAWDFHCNIQSETKKAILDVAKKRGINLCSVKQIRRGGPFCAWNEVYAARRVPVNVVANEERRERWRIR
jgi:hypothetical protein